MFRLLVEGGIQGGEWRSEGSDEIFAAVFSETEKARLKLLQNFKTVVENERDNMEDKIATDSGEKKLDD
jgi:hypothetical protein